MALTRQTLIPTVGAAVQVALTRLGAVGVQVNYVGRRIAMDCNGGIIEGEVRTQAEFVTPSGFARSIDIPVFIVEGRVVAPTVGTFEGRQAALTEDLFRSVNEAGTTYGYTPVGHIYSSPYYAMDSYKRVRENLLHQPPIRRFTKLYT